MTTTTTATQSKKRSSVHQSRELVVLEDRDDDQLMFSDEEPPLKKRKTGAKDGEEEEEEKKKKKNVQQKTPPKKTSQQQQELLIGPSLPSGGGGGVEEEKKKPQKKKPEAKKKKEEEEEEKKKQKKDAKKKVAPKEDGEGRAEEGAGEDGTGPGVLKRAKVRVTEKKARDYKIMPLVHPTFSIGPLERVTSRSANVYSLFANALHVLSLEGDSCEAVRRLNVLGDISEPSNMQAEMRKFLDPEYIGTLHPERIQGMLDMLAMLLGVQGHLKIVSSVNKENPLIGCMLDRAYGTLNPRTNKRNDEPVDQPRQSSAASASASSAPRVPSFFG